MGIGHPERKAKKFWKVGPSEAFVVWRPPNQVREGSLIACIRQSSVALRLPYAPAAGPQNLWMYGKRRGFCPEAAARSTPVLMSARRRRALARRRCAPAGLDQSHEDGANRGELHRISVLKKRHVRFWHIHRYFRFWGRKLPPCPDWKIEIHVRLTCQIMQDPVQFDSKTNSKKWEVLFRANRASSKATKLFLRK